MEGFNEFVKLMFKIAISFIVVVAIVVLSYNKYELEKLNSNQQDMLEQQAITITVLKVKLEYCEKPTVEMREVERKWAEAQVKEMIRLKDSILLLIPK